MSDASWKTSTIRQRSKGHPSTNSRPRPFLDYRRVFDGERLIDRNVNQLLGQFSFVCFLILYVLVFSFVMYCDNLLPLPRSASDRSTFSEERARNFLNEISDLGTRPTGSYANEVLAVDYLMRQLRLIESAAKSTGANDMQIEMHKSDGCFYVDFSDGLTSCYRNIKNVVAKIGPKTGRSLLVNCHFDSVPSSPGASDDAVSCAVMLEILWCLALSTKSLKHPVVFLFNGAEENFLQASHGFISQHAWSKDIVAFINLEACGAGGREVLFQAGPGNEWLVEAYSKGAKYPFGSILGQEIFQSGIIPSDTDFRIFRDFGKIPGLDFAYAKNGYVYHTRFDNTKLVIPGSIQHEGENILGTIHEIVLHPRFEQRPQIDSTKVVYFDFLGLFLIMYSGWTGYVLHGSALLLSVFSFSLKFKDFKMLEANTTELTKAIAVVLSSFLLSFVVAMIIAGVVSYLGHAMSWFYRPYWLIGLYICPSMAVLLFLHSQIAARRRKKKQGFSDWEVEEIYYNAVRLFWIALTSLMLFGGLYSAFLPVTWLLFPTLVRDLSGYLFRRKKDRSHMYYLVPHLAMQVVPMTFTAYCWLQVYSVFLPIMGRIGAHNNPDFIIAGLSTIVAFTSSSYALPVVHATKTMRHIIGFLVGVAVLSMFIVCFTPLGFPYSANPSSPAPQKFWIMHTIRRHHAPNGHVDSRDSGYWIIPLDYNALDPLIPQIPELAAASQVDCEAELYCGMPYYFPVVQKLKKTYFLPAVEPKIYSRKTFKLLSQKMVQVDVRRLNFRVEGPDHMTVIFCPYPNVNLTKWSLGNGSAYTENQWRKRPTYFVYYSYGEKSGPWDFWIELKLPLGLDAKEPIVDIAFHSHFMNGEEAASDSFAQFLDRMPKWTHPVAWTATYDHYVF